MRDGHAGGRTAGEDAPLSISVRDLGGDIQTVGFV